jgi:hypothetical protein
MIRLECATGVPCQGTVEVQAPGLSSRLQAARSHRRAFHFGSGRKKSILVSVPTASYAQMEAKGKAVARVVVRLSGGRAAKRLVSLFPL